MLGPRRSDARRSRTYAPRIRDIETIDSELRLAEALRRAARERDGPLPSTAVADALLDERRELPERATCHGSAGFVMYKALDKQGDQRTGITARSEA